MAGRIVRFDYNQLEPRILAHESGDRELIRAFNEDLDIYVFVGGETFGIPYKRLLETHKRCGTDCSCERDLSKPLVLGMSYGLTRFGLAPRIGVSLEEAGRIIKRYLRRFSGIKVYMERCRSLLVNRQVSVNLFGNVRHLPFDQNDKWAYGRAFRQAINHPIQSVASDLVLSGMVEADRQLRAQGLKALLVAEVHDELVYDVPEREVGRMMLVVVSCLESPPILKTYGIMLNVPLKVNVTIGKTWAG